MKYSEPPHLVRHRHILIELKLSMKDLFNHHQKKNTNESHKRLLSVRTSDQIMSIVTQKVPFLLTFRAITIAKMPTFSPSNTVIYFPTLYLRQAIYNRVLVFWPFVHLTLLCPQGEWFNLRASGGEDSPQRMPTPTEVQALVDHLWSLL